MHKKELLELHELMKELKSQLEDEKGFEEYEALEIDPDDIHESKSEHKKAIFVLGKELADAMAEDEFSDRGRISARMEELAEKDEDD